MSYYRSTFSDYALQLLRLCVLAARSPWVVRRRRRGEISVFEQGKHGRMAVCLHKRRQPPTALHCRWWGVGLSRQRLWRAAGSPWQRAAGFPHCYTTDTAEFPYLCYAVCCRPGHHSSLLRSYRSSVVLQTQRLVEEVDLGLTTAVCCRALLTVS